MGVINGFATDSIATPVAYVSTGGGGWDGPATGAWELQAGRAPVEVVTQNLPSEEKIKAGIDAATKAKKVYFALVNGESPVKESDTLDVSGTTTLSGERYDVHSVMVYNRRGFPRVGYGEITAK